MKWLRRRRARLESAARIAVIMTLSREWKDDVDVRRESYLSLGRCSEALEQLFRANQIERKKVATGHYKYRLGQFLLEA